MSPTPRIDWALLAREAEAVRARAYAPYSRYFVGCALWARAPGGEPRLYLGANVENATYGLTLCAERSAVSAAVVAGATELLAAAVATPGPEPGSPCGSCRQVLAEFAQDLPLALVVGGEVRARARLAKLLPGAFRGEQVFEAQRAQRRKRRA